MTTPRLSAIDHILFRTVVSALAEPGLPCAVPQGLGEGRLAEAIARAIWEPTTPVWTAPDLEALPGLPVGAADAAVLYTTGDDAARLGLATIGTTTTPELAATVLVEPVDVHTAVVLDGPGLPTVRRTVLPMTVEAIVQRNRRCAFPPMGLDLIVIQGRSVMGLPRTTRVAIA